MKKLMNNQSLRTNLLTYLIVIVSYVVMQLLSNFGFIGSAMKGQLIPICVYIVLAVSLNLVVGISGELSLGHAGFMGVGAFAGIVASTVLTGSIDNTFLRLLAAMAIGGVSAGIMGFLIGIPVMRLRGDYLAIVTLAFGEIIKNIVGNLYVGFDAKGLRVALEEENLHLAENGKLIISGPIGATGVEKISTFFMGFLLIMFTLFVVLNLINSKEGRAIKAIRDNRIAAESVGINVTAFRMKAFVVSAFLAGMAGALYGLNYSSIMASKFNFTTSINILVFVVLGGMGNMLGSVVSATVLYILPEALRELKDFRMILYAVVLILVMLFTWSPAVKDFVASATDRITRKFKKKEVGADEG
jgi:branched-chain amino acid transport system permease protein